MAKTTKTPRPATVVVPCCPNQTVKNLLLFNNDPTPTSFMLMGDGVSYVLMADGVSKILIF